jgi:hypothetical protein
MNQIDTVSKNNQIDPLTFLPEEVSMHILSYLKPSDLAGCNQVSKKWNRFSNDDNLWKMIFSDLPYLKSKEDAKNYFMTHIKVNSMEILIEKIKLFFDTHKNNNEKIIAMQYHSASNPKSHWSCYTYDGNDLDLFLNPPFISLARFPLKLEITGYNGADLYQHNNTWVLNGTQKPQSFLKKVYRFISSFSIPVNYIPHHVISHCDPKKIIDICNKTDLI